MPKNTTQCPQPGLEPGPLDPESSTLTWVFSLKSKYSHAFSSPGSPGRVGSPPRDRRAHEQEKIPRELEEERRRRSDEEEEEWEYEEDMGEEKDKNTRQGERCDNIYTLIRV